MPYMLCKYSYNPKCGMFFKKSYRRMKSKMTREDQTIHLRTWSVSLGESDGANRLAISKFRCHNRSTTRPLNLYANTRH